MRPAMAIPLHGLAGCYDELRKRVGAARVPVVLVASEHYGAVSLVMAIPMDGFAGVTGSGNVVTMISLKG